MYKEAEPMEYEKNTNENLLRDAEDILMHMPHELGSALKYVMEYTGINCRILSDEICSTTCLKSKAIVAQHNKTYNCGTYTKHITAEYGLLDCSAS